MFEDLVGGEAMVLYVNDVVGTWEDKSNVLWSVILKFYNVCEEMHLLWEGNGDLVCFGLSRAAARRQRVLSLSLSLSPVRSDSQKE